MSAPLEKKYQHFKADLGKNINSFQSHQICNDVRKCCFNIEKGAGERGWLLSGLRQTPA